MGANASSRRKTLRKLDQLSIDTDISTTRLRSMLKQFEKVNGGDSVSKEHFIQVLCANGLRTELAEEWFAMFDKNGDGCIEFQEYVLLLLSKSQLAIKAKAAMAFNMFDADGDGQLTFAEISSLIFSVLRNQYDELKEDDLRQIADEKATSVFEKADADSDGFITEQEWTDYAETSDDALELLKIVDHSVRALSGVGG